jgi:hypothetical protein
MVEVQFLRLMSLQHGYYMAVCLSFVMLLLFVIGKLSGVLRFC